MLKKGTRIPQDIEGLKGKRLLVIHGYNYGGLLDKIKVQAHNVIVDPSPDHIKAFKKLNANRGDYVLDYFDPRMTSPSHNPADQFDHVDFVSVPVYLYMSKQVPNSKELLKELETIALDILAQD